MCNVIDFKTKSIFMKKTMPKVNGSNQYKQHVIMALDGGYSSVKGISATRLLCIPSYAKKVDSVEVVGKLKDSDIVFTNHKTNETWLVGAFAENAMDKRDIATTTDESIYTRYRYDSPIYKAIMTTGLGLGLMDTDITEDTIIYLQTGLPSAYVKSDAKKLRSVLATDYDFTLRIGNETKRFTFTLTENNIGIMEQPRGTLANTVYDALGKLIPERKSILNSNTLIYDIGFGTEDLFSILSGANIKDSTTKNKTYKDTAMKSVFEAVCNEINEKYDTEFKVFELQKYLKTGKVPIIDRENILNGGTVNTIEVELAPLIEKHNRALNEKSIKRLLEEYDFLLDYNYFVVSGGTGEGRFEYIKEMLKGLTHLTVLLGNDSDKTISAIFSNVRGYYMSMLLKVQKFISQQQNEQ